ncbi:MAG: hypothetical protein ACFFAJ_04225 [Candidatus Hodarchaeota archaeon]
MVMHMIYLRTTSLRRRWARYLSQFPDIFVGKLAEGIYLMKNCGQSMLLILSEMNREGGNIEVYVLEALRIEDFLDDPEVKEMASWVKSKKNGLKVLTSGVKNLPEEQARLLEQVIKKRFSVTLNLY